MTLDAGEVYTAVKQFGLTAIAKEIYSDGAYALLFVFFCRRKTNLSRNQEF